MTVFIYFSVRHFLGELAAMLCSASQAWLCGGGRGLSSLQHPKTLQSQQAAHHFTGQTRCSWLCAHEAFRHAWGGTRHAHCCSSNAHVMRKHRRACNRDTSGVLFRLLMVDWILALKKSSFFSHLNCFLYVCIEIQLCSKILFIFRPASTRSVTMWQPCHLLHHTNKLFTPWSVFVSFYLKFCSTPYSGYSTYTQVRFHAYISMLHLQYPGCTGAGILSTVLGLNRASGHWEILSCQLWCQRYSLLSLFVLNIPSLYMYM